MKKGSFSTILLVIMMVAGLSLLLYPSFSDYWNSKRQTEAINTYAQQIAAIDNDQYEEIWASAIAYNKMLLNRDNVYTVTEEQKKSYWEQLNVNSANTMGFIEIPCIDCRLPVYHGTADTVLQVGIGHLDWTSLPTGGPSTHCVLSGHRGLPSAKLFTDLDEMVVGDVFVLNILDEVLTYEVDQIKIVLPHETDDLLITEGKDYCTLVTCTPYGINSHRMLVRGTRIDNIEEARVVRVTADAVRIEPIIVAPLLAIPVLLVLFIALLIPKPKKNRRKES